MKAKQIKDKLILTWEKDDEIEEAEKIIIDLSDIPDIEVKRDLRPKECECNRPGLVIGIDYDSCSRCAGLIPKNEPVPVVQTGTHTLSFINPPTEEKTMEWGHATLKNPCHCICHQDGDEDECTSCKVATLSVLASQDSFRRKVETEINHLRLVGDDEYTEYYDEAIDDVLAKLKKLNK